MKFTLKKLVNMFGMGIALRLGHGACCVCSCHILMMTLVSPDLLIFSSTLTHIVLKLNEEKDHIRLHLFHIGVFWLKKISRKLEVHWCIYKFHVITQNVTSLWFLSAEFPRHEVHNIRHRNWEFICIILYTCIMFLINTFFKI